VNRRTSALGPTGTGTRDYAYMDSIALTVTQQPRDPVSATAKPLSVVNLSSAAAACVPPVPPVGDCKRLRSCDVAAGITVYWSATVGVSG
jgi:hypothetical protein